MRKGCKHRLILANGEQVCVKQAISHDKNGYCMDFQQISKVKP